MFPEFCSFDLYCLILWSMGVLKLWFFAVCFVCCHSLCTLLAQFITIDPMVSGRRWEDPSLISSWDRLRFRISTEFRLYRIMQMHGFCTLLTISSAIVKFGLLHHHEECWPALCTAWKLGMCWTHLVSAWDLQVAHLLAVCWLEVTGTWKCSLPPGIYSVVWRLKVANPQGGRCQFLSWKKPLSFVVNTSDDQDLEKELDLGQIQTNVFEEWFEFEVGQIVVRGKGREVKQLHLFFSIKEVDCTYWKGGLFLDCLALRPATAQDEPVYTKPSRADWKKMRVRPGVFWYLLCTFCLFCTSSDQRNWCTGYTEVHHVTSGHQFFLVRRPDSWCSEQIYDSKCKSFVQIEE